MLKNTYELDLENGAYPEYLIYLEDGDFIFSTSGNTGFDSDGNMMMRMGDNMAMDMDSGDIHLVSSWPDDDEDD